MSQTLRLIRSLAVFSVIVTLVFALLTFVLITSLRRSFPKQIGTMVFEMGTFDTHASAFDDLDVDALRPDNLFLGEQFDTLVDPVSTFQSPSADDFDCSPDGQALMLSSQYLYHFDVATKAIQQLTTDPRLIYALAWSPDQKQIAFTDVSNTQRSIYIVNADGTNPSVLLSSSEFGNSLSWSPDGKQIALGTTSNPIEQNYVIVVINVTTRALKQIYETTGNLGQVTWSPDGSRIAFQMQKGSRFDIYTVEPDGTHLTQLTSDNAQNADPRWSPDGSLISYSSLDASGHYQLYVMNADGSDPHLVFAAPLGADAFNVCWLKSQA